MSSVVIYYHIGWPFGWAGEIGGTFQYSVLPISRGHVSPHNLWKMPIAQLLGQVMGVFHEFKVWLKIYLQSCCVVCNMVLYCTSIYWESMIYRQYFTSIGISIIKIRLSHYPVSLIIEILITGGMVFILKRVHLSLYVHIYIYCCLQRYMHFDKLFKHI